MSKRLRGSGSTCGMPDPNVLIHLEAWVTPGTFQVIQGMSGTYHVVELDRQEVED